MLNVNGITDWVSTLRVSVQNKNDSELLKIFEIYVGEAVFARRLLQQNLVQLEPSSNILEIGAGSLILSTQLVKEGFNVTAVEPVESGFSHFKALQDIVIATAKDENCLPILVNTRGENLLLDEKQDFAFSINVMEHVADPVAVINSVTRYLNPKAIYRFVCPNYTFPYEPHFNIPTIINKSITERLFHNKIFHSTHVLDPHGTWKSLNWISVSMLKGKFRSHKLIALQFNTCLLTTMFKRAISDHVFLARRPSWLAGIFKLIVKLNLHKVFSLLPANIQPVMDCTVKTK